MKLVLSTLYMLALARGDDAIVVVHDPVACLNEAALRTELPPLPTGSVLSVVVVGQLAGDEHAAAVKLDLHNDQPPLSRVLTVPHGACPTLAPIIARVVTRHLEALPSSTWPRNTPAPDAPVVVDVIEPETVASIETAVDVAHVDIGGAVSVVAGAAGFQRVSLHGTTRWLAPVVELDDTLWLGGDAFVRVGGLLPVSVDAGRVVGGDAVVGVAARATWSRWSTSLGVEGGVLGVQGVGYGTNSFALGPTVNAVTTVGVSFSPLWLDLVVRVPLVPATFSGPATQLLETPVYVGVAVSGFATIAP